MFPKASDWNLAQERHQELLRAAAEARLARSAVAPAPRWRALFAQGLARVTAQLRPAPCCTAGACCTQPAFG